MRKVIAALAALVLLGPLLGLVSVGLLMNPATVSCLSLIHISEPTRPCGTSRMPSSA